MSLLAICLDHYGTEALEWEPEYLWVALPEDFDADIPDVNKDKIQCLITCYVTNMFYVSVEFFSVACNVFSGTEANFNKWDIVTPEEAIWASTKYT